MRTSHLILVAASFMVLAVTGCSKPGPVVGFPLGRPLRAGILRM
jgi:hypothetical protein